MVIVWQRNYGRGVECQDTHHNTSNSTSEYTRFVSLRTLPVYVTTRVKVDALLDALLDKAS